MDKPKPGENVSSVNPGETGPPTRKMVHARTRELASMAGRTSLQVSQIDYETAKRELTGESDPDRQQAILDAIPETERWDPVPGSIGHQMPESPSEDADDEGRSETELVVDNGVLEAERDRMKQAEIEAAKAAK